MYNVHIDDKEYVALLDSGATIICSGSSAAQELLSDYKTRKCSGVIKTANGTESKVVGKIATPIKYNNKIFELEIFIVPEIKQNIILGMDFWKKAGLANKMSDSPLNFRIRYRNFPSFAAEGLGRTKLTTHTIDVGTASPVKQRHLPVSPAIEKIMFAEVDNMLALDVIEESTSPWSSNCVLVKKGEKYRLCLDSREVNKVTKRDAYPLPHK